MSPADYTKGYLAMASNLKGFAGLTPLAISSSDELTKQGNLEGSIKVLETVQGQTNPYVVYFVHSRMAVNNEDLGKTDLAISNLETIVKANIKVMESKTYLDLGRLYLKKGETAYVSRRHSHIFRASQS